MKWRQPTRFLKRTLPIIQARRTVYLGFLSITALVKKNLQESKKKKALPHITIWFDLRGKKETFLATQKGRSWSNRSSKDAAFLERNLSSNSLMMNFPEKRQIVRLHWELSESAPEGIGVDFLWVLKLYRLSSHQNRKVDRVFLLAYVSLQHRGGRARLCIYQKEKNRSAKCQPSSKESSPVTLGRLLRTLRLGLSSIFGFERAFPCLFLIEGAIYWSSGNPNHHFLDFDDRASGFWFKSWSSPYWFTPLR